MTQTLSFVRFIPLRDKGSPPAPSVASPPSFKETVKGEGLRQPDAFTVFVHRQHLWSESRWRIVTPEPAACGRVGCSVLDLVGEGM